MFHVALAGLRQHGTGAKKQETLENRMVEYVQKTGRECQRGRRTHVKGPEREGETEPNEDNPIFSTVW